MLHASYRPDGLHRALCGVSLDFWGYPCPPIFASYAGGGGDGRTASGGAGDGGGRRPDDASWRVTSTSLLESREYLEGLTREDRDPSWIESIEPPSGLIRDLDMLKSLWVVQYLQERGRFRVLLESTRRGRRGRAVFVEALGGPLEELEADGKYSYITILQIGHLPCLPKPSCDTL